MLRKLITLEEVKEDGRYALGEIAHLIPSVRGGSITPEALRQRIRGGLCRGEAIKVGRMQHWFLRGKEVLRMARSEPIDNQTEPLVSPAEADRAHNKTLEQMRKEGINV